MSEVSLRVRYLVAAHGRVLAAGLLAVAVVAAALTGAALTAPPETERVTRQVDRTAVEATVAAGATVTGDSTLYDRGRTLQNRAVYFTSATPTLNVTLRTAVDGADRTAVRHRIVAVIVGTIDGEQFYRGTHVLANESATTTGDPVETTTSLTVPAFEREQIGPVREEVGGAGQIAVQIRARSLYDTGSDRGVLTVSRPLTIDGSYYRLPTPARDNRTHSETVTRTVTRPANPDPPAPVRAAVAVLALAGAVATVRTRRGGPPADELAYRLERRRHDEWISEGTLPADDDAARTVWLASLSDLVDTAIDADRRVIRDPQRDAYAVFDGDTTYRFVPHTARVSEPAGAERGAGDPAGGAAANSASGGSDAAGDTAATATGDENGTADSPDGERGG